MTGLAVNTLAAVRAAGGDVKLVGPGRLKVVAPAPLPNELVERLRAAKPELLTLLTPATPHAQIAETWSDAQEERAAVAEYDGGAPREWAEALARLDPARSPGDVPPKRWLQFIDDCGRFLDQGWAKKCEALGWHALDLFGCDRERPWARIDHAGLLWLLDGRKLVALTASTATIEAVTGARQTYYRAPVVSGHVVLAWELAP